VTSSARTPPSPIASTTRAQCWILQANDGDDAEGLDLRGHGGASGRGHPRSTGRSVRADW
jgi:hypothetical protein